MKETTNSDDSNRLPKRRRPMFDRREYLRLAGAAGVAGVGMSALGGQVAADDQLKRTLTIEATGPQANYNFFVGGSVTQSRAMGASVGGDDIDGNEVTGYVTGSGRDSYAFTGELRSYSVDNEVLLYLNGEPLSDVVTIEDIPEGRPTNYELRVDGEVLKSPEMSASINNNDEVTPRDDPSAIEQNLLPGEPLAGETYVIGDVNGGKDSYAISGRPTGFTADGNVKVYLNGKRVTPGDFVRSTLTFESTDGEYASYDLSVSGDITKSKAMGATIDDNDSIGSGSANGATTGGRDSYAFTGEVTDFSGSSNLRVYLSGEEIDKATLSREPQFENTLTIEGTSGRTDYRFAVEGDLEENYGIGGEDTISGKTAEGAVGSGQDSYTFSGDISTFSTSGDGSFRTYLNGNEVDPETLGATQTTPDADQLPNEVSIRALTDARTEYGIGVSGTLATGDRSNTWSGDNASYEYARGWVSGKGLDNYTFSGELATLTDFETFQIDISRENQTISIENFNSDDVTAYEVMVSGEISTASSSGDSSVSGGTATGTIANGKDILEYTGYLVAINVEGVIETDISRSPVLAEGIISREYTFTPDKITADEYYVSDDLADQYGDRRILFDQYEYDRDEDVSPELDDELPETGSRTETVSLTRLVGSEYEWDIYYSEEGSPDTLAGDQMNTENEESASSVSAAAVKSGYNGPKWQYKRGTFRRNLYTISAPINVIWKSSKSVGTIANNMKNRRWKSNKIVGSAECSSARYIRKGKGFRTADNNLGTTTPCLAARDHIRMWGGGFGGNFKIGSVHGEPAGHIFCVLGKIGSKGAESRLRNEWKKNTSAQVSSINQNNALKETKCRGANDKYAAYIKWKV